MKNFEYVASGTTYMRIGYPESLTELSHIPLKYIRHTKSLVHNLDHNIALLYNAWTETKLGNSFEILRQELDSVYSDSGGLQIITCGKQITEDMKLQVYTHQALHSDYGMCFDEIPLQILGTKSKRNDNSTRSFDISLLKEAAKNTGLNVVKQIQKYLELKSTCRPIIIIQGNCISTYGMWYDYLMGVIPQELHQFIGGIAVSGATGGTGVLEDIERAIFYSQLPVETRHLHLLGVGSLKRLLPYIIFKKNGLLKEDHKISYDSTSMTSAVHRGNYFKGGKFISFPRHFDIVKYQPIYDDIIAKFGSITELSIEELYKSLNTPARQHDRFDHVMESYLAIIFSSIINFITDTQSEETIVKDKHIRTLSEVKNVSDYTHWNRHVGRFIESKKIDSIKTPLSIKVGV